MQIETVSLGIAIIANLILGTIVLARNPTKRYAYYFAATVFGVAIWGLGDLLLLQAQSVELATLGAKLFYAGPMVIPVSIMFFAISFPENKKPPRWLWYTCAALLTFWTVLIFANVSFLVESIVISQPFNIATPRAGAFLIYSSHFSVFFMITYAILFLKYRKARGTARGQIAYTLLGVIVASVPALLTNLVLPSMGVTNLIWLGPIFTLLFVIAVSIAIIKHRLFDIRLIVARSVGYLLSLTFLGFIYGVTAFYLVDNVLFSNEAFNDSGRRAIYVALALVFGLLFAPSKKMFDRLSNRIFYRDAYDPQKFIDSFTTISVSNSDISKLMSESANLICSSLKSSFADFVLKTGAHGSGLLGRGTQRFAKQEIQLLFNTLEGYKDMVLDIDALKSGKHNAVGRMISRRDIALVIRLVSHGKLIGFLLIGGKQSGNVYNHKDKEIFEIVADELSLAFENSLSYEEIRNFNKTLQDEVHEATLKLRRTNEKLTALDEAKDEFISMASHQLRTPLTSVKGYISMVLDGDAGELNEQQHKLLEQSFISSQRMVYLIADLLNVSRLRTGKFIIEPVPTDLPEIIAEEVSQLKETATARGLRIFYDKPARFPKLNLDETKIRQVIMNFLDNAIYYTPPGGKITVVLEAKSKTAELRITDTGLGVPKSEHYRLFDKFYRASNAKRARPDGTGLGLFMARKVIIAQHGSVIFDSTEGKGSTFGFSFPLSKVEVSEKPAA